MTVADYCELIAIVAERSPRWAVLNALDSIEELSRQAIRENPRDRHLRQQLARLRAARWREGYAGGPRPSELRPGLYLRHAQSGDWVLAEHYSEFLAQTWNLGGSA